MEKELGSINGLFNFPQGMRKMIYTTNSVEALHQVMRKLI